MKMFLPAFEIGQAVWHCQGVYRLKQQVMIREIRIHFDEYGKMTAGYLSDQYREGHFNFWFKQSDLFATIVELDEWIENNPLP